MNTTLDNPPLDSFETALLAELRREVAERPAPLPTPARGPRRRLVALGATGVAASLVAVLGPGLGGAGGSPAYAVTEDADGDVTVTVHRLEDADGLERALRDKGIDAHINFDENGLENAPQVASGVEGNEGIQVRPDLLDPWILDAIVRATLAPEADPSEIDPEIQAAFDRIHAHCAAPAAEVGSLRRVGDDWVLTVPKNSPLQEGPVEVGVDADGGLAVAYSIPGYEGQFVCGLYEAVSGEPSQR